MTYLLDVNVLLSLSDPMHVHHEAAHRWFAARGRSAWATCPITENGFIRIASHPGYPNRPGDVPVVMGILRQFCAAQGHHFWGANVSLLSMLHTGIVLTHSQITDIFLLGLAAHQGGKLATFDRRIAVDTVHGGNEALELIAP
ncbi:TA system VapC family ribonuclease toxin [Gloeobacter morelensis]|uniref:Ribonuclease VapC n=1 Tax=Gloeobacter morelensis MG652769 TaxID=2781736 RepID=A0ABY3PTL1_9CYAN|nr:TA system VapC family ribonuclease toxin [Gloeobacter morelensis]UFP97085.1 VapC toxin family PIN domain ribonuclease [Gloeobacter morelensis MG652769]